MFTGEEDHSIDIGEASAMTASFRSEYPNQPKGGYISQQALREILNIQDVVGIRFYYGLDANGMIHPVACGVTADGDDVLSVLAERTLLCPPICGKPNKLNSDM
ncbi:MAG: hypothetical protein IAE67_00445 [Candidatus Competibacteraceae bacterium]|nr:hypothetical protein [Candidatus Competibacteraceae bacterium]